MHLIHIQTLDLLNAFVLIQIPFGNSKIYANVEQITIQSQGIVSRAILAQFLFKALQVASAQILKQFG